MRRYLWLLPLPLAAAVAAFYAARGPALTINYANVTEGPVSREVLTSGRLEPARIVDVGTQVSGTIQSLDADFNSSVKVGQIVARLDPAVYDTELAQARGRAIQAQGEAERMKVIEEDLRVKLGRARALASQDLVAHVELEAAELAAKQAAADLIAAGAAAASARALLKQAEVNKHHTVIRSPIDGIIVSRNVEVGQTLAARLESPVLFRIADLRRMRLLADVGEAEVGGVGRGATVSFEIESLGSERFQGQVAEVRLQPTLETTTVGTTGSGPTATAPASTSGSRAPAAAQSATSTAGASPSGAVVSYTAVVDVDNRDHRIVPGSTAIVMLPTSRRSNAIRIPNNALTFRPSPAVLEIAGQETLHVAPVDPERPATIGRAGYVWKYEKKKFVPVPVRTGVSDERWTELVSGDVKPGDVLVTSATELEP